MQNFLAELIFNTKREGIFKILVTVKKSIEKSCGLIYRLTCVTKSNMEVDNKLVVLRSIPRQYHNIEWIGLFSHKYTEHGA